MTQREVTDHENTTWTCVQAYGTLSKETAEKAAEISENNSEVTVVCTPSGGAQTVRLQLPSDWQEKLSDEELVAQITTQQ